MIIEKHLKDYTWIFNEEKKELRLERYFVDEVKREGSKDTIEIDKTRMFSLMRFLIRISQKMSSQRRRKK